MAEFFNVLPPDEARALLLGQLTAVLPPETIATEAALGRVTAVAIYAPHPLPTFRRSTMDGYAVRAADTFGAGESLPALLQVVGEVAMGQAPHGEMAAGSPHFMAPPGNVTPTAVVIHTGGMIPATADAVVQVEHTQTIGFATTPPFEIEVLKAVAPGQNVLQVGEDVAQAAQVLSAGHWLRPQDLGGLLALGITELRVVRQPRVGILATGDEVVHPGQPIAPGQIRDINSYTVAGQVRQAGGIPILGGIIPDNFAALQQAAAFMLAQTDMLVMSAGSSVSVRDMTMAVIDSLGSPGVLLHGVATRPGKPTIVGAVGGKPVLGLPGNPVSAMIQFDMFGPVALYRLQGMVTPPLRGLVWAKLTQNIASESGREDYVPARLEWPVAGPTARRELADTAVGLLATPVLGKSNLIYTLVNADGLIKIPLNKGGLLAGEMVAVKLF